MSKYLKLDTSKIKQRYPSMTAWFYCKRSDHYAVMLLWNKRARQEPELRLYYKGKEQKWGRMSLRGLCSQYAKVGEPMSPQQAGDLWRELKLETVASLARYEYMLKHRKRKMSHARGKNPWQAATQSSRGEFVFIWPRWLTEITKKFVPCYARSNAPSVNGKSPYKLDENGQPIFLYYALMDTVREDIVQLCLPICGKCIECGACDTPCREMDLDTIVPLIKQQLADIADNIADGGPINMVQEEWFKSVQNCRMLKGWQLLRKGESPHAMAVGS